ncbi:MAG: polysaccharide lyase beta-sandwich domain-containing protein [Puniceicoccales bacterium]|nr:polysaccharide lyase beta-sandwich domain-containing protein [Puniceicoccales bacterium]
MTARTLFLRLPAFLSCILLLLIAQGSVLHADTCADLKKALGQFIEFYSETHVGLAMNDTNEALPNLAASLEYARSLQPDGSWPDIDYDSQACSGWQPSHHVSRMALLAAEARHRPEHRAELVAAVHRAFGFWIKHDFKCPNWWYNNIGIPKRIGICGLLLGEELTPDEKSYLANTIFPRAKIGMTGQNKLWLAGNTLMSGLLQQDSTIIKTASETIWQEIEISAKEGIQADFSFHQHGAQQQFGNYGMAFAVEVTRWANILRNTEWALPPERLAVFRNYMLEGQAWVSWRGRMDISSCGRQFMPNSPRDKARTIAQAMSECVYFDPTGAEGYHGFVKRNQPGATNDLVGNKFFWRSDYMVHRFPDFCATLKMSSNRVIGSEIVNSENLSGYHIADGATYFYGEGDEYAEIFPVWDWQQIPGTTTSLGKLPSAGISRVKRDFIGGVSDGKYGIAVLDYGRDGIAARKSWFFTKDAVFCLGAGINSETNDAVVTTIEQCLLHGEVTGAKGGKVNKLGRNEKGPFQWIRQGRFQYTILSEAPVEIRAEPITGHWDRVFKNPATPKDEVTLPIFKLWIPNGVHPKNAAYAYAVSLVGTTPTGKLIANTPEHQVVQLDETTWGIVFWEKGSFRADNSKTLSVDKPCVVIWNLRTGEIHLSDPTQKLKEITISTGTTKKTILLPQKTRAGSTIKVSLDS